jgi:hypothetical protein
VKRTHAVIILIAGSVALLACSPWFVSEVIGERGAIFLIPIGLWTIFFDIIAITLIIRRRSLIRAAIVAAPIAFIIVAGLALCLFLGIITPDMVMSFYSAVVNCFLSIYRAVAY